MDLDEDELKATLKLKEEINKLQKENKELKDKLHEKNMQIIKLNKLLGDDE